MGGKSRKTGGVSEKLIQRLKNRQGGLGVSRPSVSPQNAAKQFTGQSNAPVSGTAPTPQR